MSIQLTQQKEKERKIFDAFSKAFNLPSIQQQRNGTDPYPDGVLVLGDKKIAIEQTDYYFYKKEKSACNPVLDSVLDELSEVLTQEGYRGCVGVEIDQSDLFVDRSKIYVALKSIITDFINGKNLTAGSTIKVTNIHYCESKYADRLSVKRFACDITTKFCRMITPEEATAGPLRNKEDKLWDCPDRYDEHWIIITIPWNEHVGIDDRQYSPIVSPFDRVYLHEQDIRFNRLRTLKPKTSLQSAFDLAKKRSEGGRCSRGYQIGDILYRAYFTNEEWEAYINDMPLDIKKQYEDGRGKELECRMTRYGNKIPPKMASYGSSSRMIYELSIEISAFKFEHQLPTVIGGPLSFSNLDGYIEQSNTYIEAKCREIYSTPLSEWKDCYARLYSHLKRSSNSKFDYCEHNGKFSFKWDGQQITGFDLKQMICHLLGIANYHIENGQKHVNFIYLVYKPSEQLLSNLSTKLRDTILEHWENEKNEACMIDFAWLYNRIWDYLCESKKMNIVNHDHSFTFFFCNQNNYLDTIKSL